MHCEREIAPDLYWIGGDDKRLGLFDASQPVPDGMSYNTYLLLDEKAVLVDAIDRAVEERFFATLDHLLGGRELDYIVVNHAEPDHTATLGVVANRNPGAEIVCTEKCAEMLSQFYGSALDGRIRTVSDGDSLDCGKRMLAFAEAPMVHWPEVMVTYDVQDKILFSADAFGKFGTLDGRLFDDEYDFGREWLPEARRYYANITGKYGPQVNELLDKAETLDIDMIAPLHGPIIRSHIADVVSAHRKWASYEPESHGVVIAYASIYGGTRDVAEKLALRLSELGVHDLSIYDLAVTDVSYVLAEAFRASNIVLASVTYNAGVFPRMAELVDSLVSHNLRNRSFSFIQNGSWGPIAGKLMQKSVERIPGAEIVGDMLTIRSRMTSDQDAQLEMLARAIAESANRAIEQVEIAVEAIAEPPRPIVGAARPKKPPVKRVSPVTCKPHGGLSAGIREAHQNWRCRFCGTTAEVPEDADMRDYECPACYRAGGYYPMWKVFAPY